MKKMLITGGTVFVSRFAAEYFSEKYDVYVLNRNTRPQCEHVTLIEADRHNLGDGLKYHHFDIILDITAYNAEDITDLLEAVGSFDNYIMISSSAVYPETEDQPFTESTPVGPNKIWGKYGTDKIEAERALRKAVPNAYILRPPYLYGPGNNVYREAFVFDCALADRPFYLPGEGEMNLQFFYVEDLCKIIDNIITTQPKMFTINVGNTEIITIRDWVKMCYGILMKTPEFINVNAEVNQRSYFPFYAYEYVLDVSAQKELLPQLTPLKNGIQLSLKWYQKNQEKVNRKPLLTYIDEYLS